MEADLAGEAVTGAMETAVVRARVKAGPLEMEELLAMVAVAMKGREMAAVALVMAGVTAGPKGGDAAKAKGEVARAVAMLGVALVAGAMVEAG